MKTLKLPSFLTPKASIFISFLSQTSLFSLFLCLQVHFLCFSIFHFRSSSYSVLPLFSFWFHFCLSHCMLIVFYESILQAEKVEEDTKATIFNSKKLGFLSHFYLKQVCFLCFSVYRFIFFVSLFLHLPFLLLSIPLPSYFVFFVSPTSIFVRLHFSSYSVLLLFSFWFHFCFSHCMFIVFYESLLYADKVEEDTKAVIFNSKRFVFLSHFYLKHVCFFYFSVYVFFISFNAGS